MSSINASQVLETKPVGKLLLQYSIPAIIGMTVTSLYNIIDSVFIGHGVGPLAISGLAITFPLMNLIIAFSTLVGIDLSRAERHGENEFCLGERVVVMRD